MNAKKFFIIMSCVLSAVYSQDTLSSNVSKSKETIDQNRRERVNAVIKKENGLISYDEIKAKTKQFIATQDYKGFENYYQELDKKFKESIVYERALKLFFSSLDHKDDKVMKQLDRWVKLYPTYLSYAARGSCKVSLGYHYRGEKWISETPRENIIKMMNAHVEAQKDLWIAIRKNNRLINAYCGLIQIEKTSGDIEAAKKIHDLAIKAVPESYYIRDYYLQMLVPRWGGSYALMLEYTGNLDKEYDLNPKNWLLNNIMLSDMANMALHEKNKSKAIKLYTEALKYGDQLYILKAPHKNLCTSLGSGRSPIQWYNAVM